MVTITSCIMLDTIVDYQKDPGMAISQKDQVKIVNGKKVVSCSTRGWELSSGVGIPDEPTFNWLVTWVLKKRDWSISLVKCQNAQYHNPTHKFGIELPKTVDEANAINKATCITFWHNAIEWMKNVWVAFDVLTDGVVPPTDHQYMKCHMIFDIKMEDFCCKALLVARGHITKAPATLTYASIMSRETMHIALPVAVLNDVDIWATDVVNA
ncbi:hypothetical protein ACHAW6_010651 [Cyclotella cf. meneghiniana]